MSPENLPVVGIQIMSDNQLEVEFTTIDPTEARHLAYLLIGLASEVETQEAYITALRSRKENELEIMMIVEDAAAFINHKRSLAG